MTSFLVAEREQGGWRFLLLWIIATSIGLLIGVSAEITLLGRPTLYIAIPIVAILQAYVINRHISIYLPWAVGTSVLWILGLFISTQVINVMLPPTNFVFPIVYLAIVSFFSGILAAIPQWIFMRDWLERIGIWWLLVNGISSALFFLPGIITGVILMNLITADKVSMEERHYELVGDY